MNQLTFDWAELQPSHHAEPFGIACGERPQARLETFGAAALSDTELVATILQGNSTRPENALTAASRLISEAGSLAALGSWQPADFQKFSGIGRSKASRLAAVAEIGRRMMRDPGHLNVACDRPDAIATYLRSITAGLQVEKFWVLCLNRRNRLLKLVQISSGTATSTLAHPREVFREAIRYAATAIICVHNHPGGDPAPSSQDLHVTRLLREASRAVDIALLDHVICGNPTADPLGQGFFSFRLAGLL